MYDEQCTCLNVLDVNLSLKYVQLFLKSYQCCFNVQSIAYTAHTDTQTRLQGGQQLYEAVLMNKAIRAKIRRTKKRSEQNAFQIFVCLFLLFYFC